MLLAQLHAKLLDSLRAGAPLVIELHDMVELWNDIKETLSENDAISLLLELEGGP